MDGKIGAFRALDISSAGMSAESRRLETIAVNLANAQSTRTPQGGPYRRREVVFETIYDGPAGEKIPLVKVAGMHEDDKDFKRIYRPHHPDADGEGFVMFPNVDPVYEMVDMMEAMRAYEANSRASRAFKTMAESALQIGR